VVVVVDEEEVVVMVVYKVAHRLLCVMFHPGCDKEAVVDEVPCRLRVRRFTQAVMTRWWTRRWTRRRWWMTR
jgi:hypothetical protein